MIYTLQSKLPRWHMAGKRVFLRADLNVPTAHGAIIDDFRLERTQKTIDYLVQNDAIIILATHIGRPVDHEMSMSTKMLMPWFKERGYSILFEPSLEQASKSITQQKPATILLLENLRFFEGEKQGDSGLASRLASMADYYVNDAFGSIHRSDTSITLVPHYFSAENRTIGFLIEDELKELNKLLVRPNHPFTIIAGGGKVTEKLTLINNMLDVADTLLICPALAFSFLSSVGINTGVSYKEPQAFELCNKIRHKAQSLGKTLLLPLDYVVAQGSLEGALTTISQDNFNADSFGITIGIETTKLYTQKIKESKTVFYSGLMGFNDQPESLAPSIALFDAMAHSESFTILGGGDTVAAARKFGYASSMSFCSTGGGATLSYLSGASLPGLNIFINE